MVRISPAVPPMPIRMIGIHKWFMKSPTLAQVQGASANWLENNPIIACPKYFWLTNRKINANKKLGTANPMNPIKVAT